MREWSIITSNNNPIPPFPSFPYYISTSKFSIYSWKIMVNGKDDIPYIMENTPNVPSHQPVKLCFFIYLNIFHIPLLSLVGTQKLWPEKHLGPSSLSSRLTKRCCRPTWMTTGNGTTMGDWTGQPCGFSYVYIYIYTIYIILYIYMV